MKMIQMTLLTLVFLSLSTLSFSSKADAYIVVQGLGNKFEVMKDIVDDLKLRKHTVYEIHLRGHSSNDYEELKSITADKWRDQFVEIYNRIPLNEKKHFVGYSLGAAVGIYTMSSMDSVVFDSATFLAPAVAIWPYAHLVKVLEKIGFKSIFSLAPDTERAFRYTPMQTYKALFEVESKTQKVNTPKLNKMKVTILMDTWDMLVSYSGMKKWLKSNKLTNWKLIEVDAPRDVRHMLTQKAFLPVESWNKILEAL